MTMRILTLALVTSAALTASVMAQTPPPTETSPPSAPAAAPAVVPPAVPAPVVERAPGAPANICAELVAFLTPKPPPTAASNAPPQAAPPQQPQPQASSAQQSTGQSGTAVEAPKDGAPKGPAGGANNAPQQSGISAPVPKSPEAPKKKPSITLEQAQALAQSNDIPACHAAARKERRAGVDLPLPLMSLAALDLKFHQQAASAAPPGGSVP
jgi:hypothetical protein